VFDSAQRVAESQIPARRRSDGRIPAWRRVRRIAMLALAICLIPVALSWSNAITGPRNIGIGVATVEWVRAHGGNPLVSEIENIYYSMNAPSKGGPALKKLPQVGVAEAGGEEGEEKATAYRPPPIKPLIHPALKGEGVWHPAGANAGPNPPVLLTTFRSDPEYPQFVAGVAWINHEDTHLTYVPGLVEPPEIEHRGPAEIPPSLRNRVVASFNGGFPLETSNAGLIYRGQIIAPMVNGIATVVEYKDGRVDIVKWESGENPSPRVWFAKQNLPPIIYEGQLNPNLSDGPEWGATVNNAIRVWRSGLGIDAHGNLIYTAANYQTVESLAEILKRAGAVRAIELDINEDWTSFITYRHPGAVEPSNLLPEMYRPAERYLTPDERDFFAVYLRKGASW
jgi:hypothetical protein